MDPCTFFQRTAYRCWAFARAWLYDRLGGGTPDRITAEEKDFLNVFSEFFAISWHLWTANSALYFRGP